MTKTYLAPLGFGVALALGACSATPTSTATDAAACAADLVASGIVNPGSILATAASAPACQGLAADLLAQLEGLATAKATAARWTMRLQ